MPFFDALRSLLTRFYESGFKPLEIDQDMINAMEETHWCAVKAEMSEARSGNFDILRIWFNDEITPELTAHLNHFFEGYSLLSRVLTLNESSFLRKKQDISCMEIRGPHLDHRLPGLRKHLEELGVSFDIEVFDNRYVHYHAGNGAGYDDGYISGFGSNLPRH